MKSGVPEHLPKSPEHKKEIPLSWFMADGSEQNGIMHISFSAEFTMLGKGRLAKYMMEGGEEEVREITGFTIAELNAKRKSLERAYKGTRNAPFEMRLSSEAA